VQDKKLAELLRDISEFIEDTPSRCVGSCSCVSYIVGVFSIDPVVLFSSHTLWMHGSAFTLKEAVIDTARVPVVKLLHKPTSIDIGTVSEGSLQSHILIGC
jgi:hypothetical protein